MKAKYQIGMLVKAKREDGDTTYGEVDSVITRKEGYSYTVDGFEFTEDDIVSAYRPVETVSRKRPAKRVRKGKAAVEESADNN